MEENQPETSSSTPQLISFGNTPKRAIFHQHIGTPFQRVKDCERSAYSSTPQVISFGTTPRRNILPQHIGTPLQRIKDGDRSEREQGATPVSANPFEVKADSLYFPSCSPSVFATFARNKVDNGQFRWSIDHVSVLYPADIDETSIQDVWVDPDQEMKAQKAIDAFFSQSSIVPSPWSSGSKDREVKFRRTVRGSALLDATSNDVATQTMVTIPPTVDLMALLGEEYKYNDEHERSYSSSCSTSSDGSSRESDIMSTSSLRRKLFVNDESCKTPSRIERKDLLLAKQWSTPTASRRSMQSTPSDLLSSSPITPPNCSESCVIRSSPQMSPIAPSSQKSVRMRSFNERLDEESNSQLTNQATSSQYMHTDTSMSFCMDSQDTCTFPFDASEKQDTGYVTGSMLSLQNVTSSDTTSGFHSRVTPVTELLDDCGISNVALNMSCVNSNLSIDAETIPFSKYKEVDSVLYGSSGWSLVPNSCSTPAFNL